MKIMVAYNGSSVSKTALKLARDHALVFGAHILVLISSEGGASESAREINEAQKNMQFAQNFMAEKNVSCEGHEMARGLSPGEDIVKFADDNQVDLIYVGIQKKSRVQKIIMGSTAQFVILRSKCPVVTVNYEQVDA